jgi:hypothetical protein
MVLGEELADVTWKGLSETYQIKLIIWQEPNVPIKPVTVRL